MGSPSFSSVLMLCVLGGTIAPEIDPLSIVNDQGNSTALKQKVSQLEDRMSAMENSIASIPQMIQAENEQLLITVLDEMELKFENYAKTINVLEFVETLRKEFHTLLYNHSLLMKDEMRNQSLLINKLSSQLEDVRSISNCLSEPPSTTNGRPVNYERKHGSEVGYKCDQNFIVIGNSTVRCHFGKWEGQPPVCTLFSNTFILRAFSDSSNRVSTVSCSSAENPQKILFSRLLDTGTGQSLPLGAKTYSRGTARFLDLSGVDYRFDRNGVYKCGYERGGKSTEIAFAIERDGYFVLPEEASIGATVQFAAQYTFSSWSKRWLHDGKRLPAADGQVSLEIAGVRKEDAGVYERYDEDYRRTTQVFFRLVVKNCPANRFGARCDHQCPPCYNGGTCDELLGTCTCPPGFDGRNCEVVCGENRFGPNCSESCGGRDCKGQVFCKIHPFGCSCAPGYRGSCAAKCNERQFGAGCKQDCHCAVGPCDPYTGACSGACASGWTGQSCQIPDLH